MVRTARTRLKGKQTKAARLNPMWEDAAPFQCRGGTFRRSPITPRRLRAAVR